MTDDEILLLADTEIYGSYTVREVTNAELIAFARAIEQRAIEDNRVCYALEPNAVKIGLAVQESVAIAVAEEREACASLAEQMVALRVAKAIRAREE
jgi:N-acetyl-beta-hexosaminidase